MFCLQESLGERNKMKRKVWTSEETERARELLKKHSYSTVGRILHSNPQVSTYSAK